ncbi:MAG: trehalose-phosphatase [Acidothermaceae bacterium]
MSEPVATTAAGAEGLRALLAAPEHALVGLDFDGTLAPIVDDPARAAPASGAREAIAKLVTRVGHVVIVTGRPAATAAEMLGLGRGAPSVEVLGHYGLERWTSSSGTIRRQDVEEGDVAGARSELPGLLSRAGAPAGTAIEDKGESVAVHVRRTADPVGALELLCAPLAALATDHGLRLEPGRMVLELRPIGIDKGLAIERLAAELEATVVCYAGDDLGDLAAFDAVDRLRAQGVAGFTMCVGSPVGPDAVPALAARADFVVESPVALVESLNWLSASLASE